MTESDGSQGRKLNVRKIVTLAGCLVIAYLVWSVLAALAYLWKADREATRTFAELQSVSAQTLEKQKEFEYHGTREYVEKTAREDMLLSRKGDTVILFPLEKPSSEQPVAGPSGLPWLVTRVIEWVKGLF